MFSSSNNHIPSSRYTGYDEERAIQPPPSPLSPKSPRSLLSPLGSPPNAGKDSYDDLAQASYRRRRAGQQSTWSVVKRWLFGPPVLLLCIVVVFGLAWLVYTRLYGPIKIGGGWKDSV